MSDVERPEAEDRSGVAPDPSLTIPAKRLAGSEHCLNCGAKLHGPYCSHCGQPDKRFQRVLPVLLRDLAADMIDLDARFFRTLIPLLLRPGVLTRDFLEGKRFRFTPPLRLYLFSSVLFFLLAALYGADFVTMKETGGQGPVVVLDDEGKNIVVDSTGRQLAKDVSEGAKDARRDDGEDFNINFNGEPWDPVDNPVDIDGLPEFVNDWINDEIAESPEKARAIGEDPKIFMDKIRDLLPGTIFLLLPVAALLLLVWYPLSKRYYVEHLIFALHSHAFVFVTMSAEMTVENLQHALTWQGQDWVVIPCVVLRVCLTLWVPVHFLFSLKRVYKQGWIATLFKCWGLTTCYGLLLLMVTGFVAVVSFVLL